jgi:hypothetical protein
MDFFNPKSATENAIKRRIVRCYEAANPKKLIEVDGLVKKYIGHETKLFAKLEEKYSKYPECRFR